MSDVSQTDVSNKVQQWTNDNKFEANKTPEEIQDQQTALLYRNFINARNTMNNAPSDYEEARENYLRSKLGNTGFEEQQQKELAAEGQRYSRKATSLLAAKVRDARKSLTMFKSILSFYMNLGGELSNKVSTHTKLAYDAKSAVDFSTTSNRKTYYLYQERATVDAWDTALSLIIVACGLVFAKHYFYDRRKLKNVFLWFCLLLIFLASYLLPKIVNWIMNLPKAVNIYTSWAKDKEEWHGD